MLTTRDLVAHFQRQRGWTRRLIAAIPAETEFGCGDLVRHLIQAEIFWRRLLQHGVEGEVYDPFELASPPGERMEEFRGPNLEASRDPRFGNSFAECLEIWASIEKRTVQELSQIPDDALTGTSLRHPLTGLEASVGEMFLVMIEHEAHHRGQLSGYLKVLGERQPAEFGT
jgi:uncharacterized damage-inducible protein DinB